jgi:hypothetical protein
MIMSTWSTSAAPVSPRPVATSGTSSGRPVSRTRPSTTIVVVNGVISDGLITTALPAINAGAESPIAVPSG